MPKRRRFTASQKAAIVLEVLKEEKTIAQIASENSIHPNQIYKWKTQALENFAGLFEEDRKGEKAQTAAHEKQITELYTEIGKLSTQLNWLKKNQVCLLSRTERLPCWKKITQRFHSRPRQRCLVSVIRACSISRLGHRTGAVHQTPHR